MRSPRDELKQVDLTPTYIKEDSPEGLGQVLFVLFLGGILAFLICTC